MQYPGQIPLETDPLGIQRNVMIGLGWVLQGTVGAGTYVDGFTCIPTGPASQSVQVTAGQILSVQNVDNSAYSSEPADTTHQIVKQGLLLNTATFTCAAPLTSGQSVNYLIEVTYQDLDGTPVVLPYYNAANPNVAWSGPNNTGVAQNTVRQGLALVQIKAGTPATTGTQVTPTPDAGFVGMFVVTVAFGQTTITGTSIATLATAPFIPAKLGTIPNSVQSSQWTYAVDTGSANNIVASVTPAPTALVAGLCLTVKVAAAPTGATVFNLNGFGNKAVVYAANGAALLGGEWGANALLNLEYDGTSWRLMNMTNVPAEIQAGLWISVDDTSGAANTITIAPSPAITAYAKYQRFQFKLANTITGASTINVNGLGAKNLTRADTSATQNGDGVAGQIMNAIYDGTQFQLIGLRAQVPGQNSQTFTTPGTTNFTVPAGIFTLRGECWGGGGGSGGSTGAGSAAVGGGGGGYCKGLMAVTPGQVIAITVGAGGTAGSQTGPTNGGTGGMSSIGAFMSSTGGALGIAAASVIQGGTSAAGGVGTGGSIMNVVGCNSDAPLTLGGVTNNVAVSAGGGSWGGLKQHTGATSISSSGTAGIFPGGGAGGSANAAPGAAGAAGQVILEW